MCKLCNDGGWVCEEHPTVEWGSCPCGGAGMECICMKTPEEIEQAQKDAEAYGYRWVQKDDGDWDLVKINSEKKGPALCKHQLHLVDGFLTCKKCGKRIVVGNLL